MTSRQNGVRDQAYHTSKQQTARQHSVHWWLSHQRPVRVRFHCQERCDHHPWRQCSPYSPNLQLKKGGGSSHSCPPLDFLKKETDHTSHYPLRFNVPGTKLKSGIGSPEWYVLVFDMQVRKLLRAFCPDHVWVKGNGRADRPAGKATTASGLCCGTSEVPRR